jgi:hypothetical protein
MSVQVAAGVYMYYMDFNYPFANIKEAGEYIVQHHLDRFPIIGGLDFVIMPLSYYTHKPIYAFDRDDTSRYTIWDQKRNSNLSPTEFFSRMLNHVQNTNADTALLCVYVEAYINKHGVPTPVGDEPEDLTPDYKIRCIKKIDNPCMIATYDNYYLYLLWKK